MPQQHRHGPSQSALNCKDEPNGSQTCFKSDFTSQPVPDIYDMKKQECHSEDLLSERSVRHFIKCLQQFNYSCS